MSATENQKSRGTGRSITGYVTSTKMEKTITVTVNRRFRDRHFHKFVTRRVKYHAHDPNNSFNVGDFVEIVEAAPASKTKRWRVSRVIEKSREVAS